MFCSPSPGWGSVAQKVSTIKTAVKYTPLAFYMRVEAPFQAYNGGVFTTACAGTNINHGASPVRRRYA